MNPILLITISLVGLYSPKLNASSVNACYNSVYELDQFSFQDTTRVVSDSISAVSIDSIAEVSKVHSNKQVNERSIREILSVSDSGKLFSWVFNNRFFEYDKVEVDTSLFLNHLFYPQQKKLESYTFLGNIGSPTQYDHFFSRDEDFIFLPNRFYHVYSTQVELIRHYNTRSPFTNLFYSTAGKRSQSEQLFSAIHTQNVNKYIGFALSYDHFGTKGVYENQETRDNVIKFSGNYHKGNVAAHVSFSNLVINNKENGGVINTRYINDTIESRLLPVWLLNAKSTSRERSIYGNFGYTLINIKRPLNDSLKTSLFFPLVSAKILFKREQHSRVFKSSTINKEYFENSYFSNSSTNDTISLVYYDGKVLLEINQFSNFPGMPGIRGFLGYENFRYEYFKPQDYLAPQHSSGFYSTYIGATAFSNSPYLQYRGTAIVYFGGHRAEDKLLEGEVLLSPWRNSEMPQLKGRIIVSEKTSDVLVNSFFSNHFQWENRFAKEKRFQIQGAFEVKKWEAEVGYNLAHLADYLYFDTQSNPKQADNITVTSLYVKKNFHIGRSFNFINNIVWQVNSNAEVLNIPMVIAFSSLFYQRELVKNALVGQIGLNVTYRTKFYADAFNPAIGQFFNQRKMELGGYPVVDVFANFKWKRAIVFLKYEHLNQGYPHHAYFSAYSYPINPQIFKFGVSWIFYD